MEVVATGAAKRVSATRVSASRASAKRVSVERVSIDRRRLLERIAELGSIGAIEGTEGCSRLALTDADRAGRDLVVTWMHDLGLDVRVDGIGNVVATMPGYDPGLAPVMTGSHIDTVAAGGRYDGNLGVLAGLEVVESVLASGVVPPRPLAVAFFTGEEGARFAPDMLGSLVHVGGLALEDALAIEDVTGTTVGEELERIGYRGPAPLPGPVPHAFVELHIEQGPVLEDEGVTIGVVEGVQGISWTELTLRGQACHAGTTPMRLRRDPGLVAATIAVGVRQLALDLGPPQVATVGALTPRPNLVNVVPSSATLTVDLRHPDDATLRDAEDRLGRLVAAAATAEGVEVDRRPLARFEPVRFDPRVVDLVERVATDHGLSSRRLPSGAGHDAQMLARVCPAGMIFVPSAGGISHDVTERTTADDVGAGAEVLADVLLRLAHDGGGPERPDHDGSGRERVP